mmetsp:Transcript_23981/g.52194  ORF Transcript_23981/g.52194 Transcript_23981/m.52194 type:complete len:313 (-) Transcript_23981:795-1733(-)
MELRTLLAVDRPSDPRLEEEGRERSTALIGVNLGRFTSRSTEVFLQGCRWSPGSWSHASRGLSWLCSGSSAGNASSLWLSGAASRLLWMPPASPADVTSPFCWMSEAGDSPGSGDFDEVAASASASAKAAAISPAFMTSKVLPLPRVQPAFGGSTILLSMICILTELELLDLTIGSSATDRLPRIPEDDDAALSLARLPLAGLSPPICASSKTVSSAAATTSMTASLMGITDPRFGFCSGPEKITGSPWTATNPPFPAAFILPDRFVVPCEGCRDCCCCCCCCCCIGGGLAACNDRADNGSCDASRLGDDAS